MDPPPTTRRRFVVRGLSFASVGLAGCTQQAQSDAEQGTESPTTETGQQSPEPTSPISALGVERLGEGFTSPVGLEMPDESRRFVVDQVGVVHLLDDDGVADDPYLDLRDRVVDVSGFSERGLLGLALHPDFAENGRLFVRYSSRSRPGTPTDYSHTFVLSEFTADPNARTVDRATERVVLTIPQPQSNHNAGSVAFGPDGYLYVGVGDGGAGGDQGTGHVEDWYEGNAGGNGQDVTRNLLGSVLRIDVDGRDDGKAYAVPEDNPLVGTDGLPEHYAWGFRNPWRLSFGPDGRLFVADVGQSEWEEVDIVEQGGNYGWNVREGSHCFRANECPDETPDGNPSDRRRWSIHTAATGPPESRSSVATSTTARRYRPCGTDTSSPTGGPTGRYSWLGSPTRDCGPFARSRSAVTSASSSSRSDRTRTANCTSARRTRAASRGPAERCSA
ncbi:PQQ-dependent sugar dehydrogenase [Haloarculaceae archaeon H-GB2-1]|nr:PQQ-dependent sugar dehydrogenase [Haloarculaceae archaeon H-GB11]MEA5407866.1 PQQ-dependent sugar dehydrogenase [Haloarculaceae archaeon H-GB2-1]